MVLAACTLIALGIVLQVAARPLQSLGLEPTPQRYVALDFPDPAAIPTRANPGSRLSFRFQIDNETGRTLHQAWRVYVLGARGPVHLAAQGIRTIPRGRSVTVHATVPVGVLPSVIEVRAPGTGIAPLRLHVAARVPTVSPT